MTDQTQIYHRWNLLKTQVWKTLEDPDRAAFDRLLDSLKEDVQGEAGRILLGFRRAPAARGNHHATEGGLVQHLLEMWNIWGRLGEDFLAAPHVTPQRVLKAIILHDLHKAYRTYELLREDPWETRYCDDATDMLMTSDIKSIWLAQRAGVELDPEQINALLWAEGGFSKIRPQWCSVLAKVCYTLDELSGNGLGRIRNGTLLSHRKPTSASA